MDHERDEARAAIASEIAKGSVAGGGPGLNSGLPNNHRPFVVSKRICLKGREMRFGYSRRCYEGQSPCCALFGSLLFLWAKNQATR
jgi:hypothetical protein